MGSFIKAIAQSSVEATLIALAPSTQSSSPFSFAPVLGAVEELAQQQVSSQ
jgi:hypothetical protein